MPYTVTNIPNPVTRRFTQQEVDLANKNRMSNHDLSVKIADEMFRPPKISDVIHNIAVKHAMGPSKHKTISTELHRVGKEAYGHFSNSPKAQMIAGGTAAAIGAGLAAKRYLQRKKK